MMMIIYSLLSSSSSSSSFKAVNTHQHTRITGTFFLCFGLTVYFGHIFKNGKDGGLALILLGSISKMMMMPMVNNVVNNDDYILFCLPMVILMLMVVIR